MSSRLDGRRVLVTHAHRYLGPPVVELFRAEGATVLADESELTGPDEPEELVARSGRIDVLVANLAGPPEAMPVTGMMVRPTEFTDEAVRGYIDALVWPLLRIVRATLAQMFERGSGKIVAITSATPERAIPGLSIYSAARGAQNAFLQVVGAEAAPHNVQVNAIGPAHIENNMYYTEDMLADRSVRESFEADIPAGRLGKGHEAAELALALASGASDFLAGQLIPVSGGWTT
ncbi:SDR family oxidoreductase [Amycolatopsis antarctica]|nr:SDR family oxidoreductase [Amycolatopsis antarctica]